nr:hypothetical protein CFP56_48002 [Quercus suber]
MNKKTNKKNPERGSIHDPIHNSIPSSPIHAVDDSAELIHASIPNSIPSSPIHAADDSAEPIHSTVNSADPLPTVNSADPLLVSNNIPISTPVSIPSLRKSTRISKAPAYLQDYKCSNVVHAQITHSNSSIKSGCLSSMSVFECDSKIVSDVVLQYQAIIICYSNPLVVIDNVLVEIHQKLQ